MVGANGRTGTLPLARSFAVARAWATIARDLAGSVFLPVPLRIVIVAVRFLFFAVR